MGLNRNTKGMLVLILTFFALEARAHDHKPAQGFGQDILVSFKHQKTVRKDSLHGLFTRLRETVVAIGGEPHHARVLFHAGRDFEIDPFFLASVAFVESNFRPNIKSNRNAKGLMQLRPVVLEVLGVTNPWDPYQNVMAGAAYLRHCFERYSKYDNSTYLALAAYNIGPGRPQKLEQSESASRFVKKVLTVYNRLSSDPSRSSRHSLNAELVENRIAGVR